MTGWKEVYLEEVASEVTVGHVGPMASEYRPSGVPFLRSKDIEPFRVNTSDLVYIDDSFHRRLRKSSLSPGDVVIVRTGKPGTCAVIPDSVEVANCSDLVIVRPDESLDPRFLMYYVNSAALGHIAAHLVGAVQQHFNVGSAKRMKLLLPPIEEQRAIAHVLGTLDDKIELNRQMNQTLGEIARTLFRSWFVDFDPVRAKAESREPEGMDAETAALFPDRFVDSELGPIPEGWDWQPLDEMGSFLNGLALQKYPPQNDGSDLPVIKIAQLRANSTVGADAANYDVPSQYHVEDGDFLFSWSGSLLASIWSGGKGALNQHLFKVTTKYPQWFVYYCVQEHLEHFRNVAADKATTMGHINRHHLTSAMCAVPTSRVLAAGGQTIGTLMSLALSNALESRTLAGLRDTLLPELLSGRMQSREMIIAGSGA